MSNPIATAVPYEDFPDNESSKVVALYVSPPNRSNNLDPRHVFLCWPNGESNSSSSGSGTNLAVFQVVQLERRDDGFRYIYPNVWAFSQSVIDTYQKIPIGTFTRDDREKILELAEGIRFHPRSNVNGCGVWMRRLLGQMVIDDDKLLGHWDFLRICNMVPLPNTQPES